MTLSEMNTALDTMQVVRFRLPDGSFVASHFHVTEVGQTSKRYIDCGGTVREETKISLQLWQAEDYDHRLTAGKLLSIINLSVDKLQLPDVSVQVEYQGPTTIETYNLSVKENHFQLEPTHTDCLAQDACGVAEPVLVNLDSLIAELDSSCTPGSGCC